MAAGYAELRALSNITFLRGASHPEELVAQADALGYTALAVTAACSLSGIVRAHAAVRERNQRGNRLPMGLQLERIEVQLGAVFRLTQPLDKQPGSTTQKLGPVGSVRPLHPPREDGCLLLEALGSAVQRIQTLERLAADKDTKLHSRKLRSFDEPPFR